MAIMRESVRRFAFTPRPSHFAFKEKDCDRRADWLGTRLAQALWVCDRRTMRPRRVELKPCASTVCGHENPHFLRTELKICQSRKDSPVEAKQLSGLFAHQSYPRFRWQKVLVVSPVDGLLELLQEVSIVIPTKHENDRILPLLLVPFQLPYQPLQFRG